MIRSFRHKGLQRFFETGSIAGIRPNHATRLNQLLTIMNAATSLTDLAEPSFRLHALAGSGQGRWSLRVNVNWRLTFRFENKDFTDLDYEDYH